MIQQQSNPLYSYFQYCGAVLYAVNLHLPTFIRVEDQCSEEPDHLHKVVSPDICQAHQYWDPQAKSEGGLKHTFVNGMESVFTVLVVVPDDVACKFPIKCRIWGAYPIYVNFAWDNRLNRHTYLCSPT